MKYFNQEIEKFYNKLLSGEKFAFSKYADGEWMAINKTQMDSGNGEWTMYQTNDSRYEQARQLLVNSFMFQDPGYYVGISCPCCQGIEHYNMKQFSGQNEEQLTFANLFVNANYSYFIENFIPEFSNHDIVLVSNKRSTLSKLPFNIDKFYAINYNAWIYDLYLIDHLISRNYKNKLFLFSCGPLGNILAYKLWENNKNNTYLDIGSTLDRWLNNDYMNKRLYAIDDKSCSERVCVWGE
jgi:hypothetical protein